jgi:predicted AlkP superfamily pyrophosphatase or phosphodiesterase
MTASRTGSLLVTAAAVTLLTLAACAAARTAPQDGRQAVVLVSLDGFHPDYLRRLDAPNLRALAGRGVAARWMEPVFPSNTFPNHYTIVTGLLPAHHGIVDNHFVDPVDGVRFRYSAPEAREARWWGGEPLWVTAERQGVRSASFFWPGSDIEDGRRRPSIWRRYDGRVPNETRVDSVLAWLRREGPDRPRFVTLYFSDVDHWGHERGPDSPELAAAVARVDSMIGRLVEGLRRQRQENLVNIIIVSDHGMASLSRDRLVILDDYVHRDSVYAISLGSTINLRMRPGMTPERVVQALAAAPRVHVYQRERTPGRWRYRDNPRIADVTGVMDAGWLLTTRAAVAARRDDELGGAHGFDNADSTMRATFIAAGPAFRSGVVVEPFQNLHVYELICGILGIAPSRNDGSPDSTRAMLR